MPDFDLAIHGNLVLPDRVLTGGTILVRDGAISDITDGAPRIRSAAEVIEAGSRWVLPGAIDAHVHCYSYAGEGFVNATRSAAAGGVTTIIEMPYDAEAPVNNVDTLRRKMELLEQAAVVDVALLGTIRKTGGLDQIPRLADEGVCGFKVSLFETHPDRFPRIADGELREAFKLIRESGRTVGVHAEDGEIVDYLLEQYQAAGKTYPQAHCETRPPVSESVSVLKALELAADTGVRLHVYHTSLARCFRQIEAFREFGVSATAETCPHYLLLAQEDMDQLGAFGKINPPLRPRSEQVMLWQLLAEDRIDIVTSDHAPWPRTQKQDPNIFKNSSGTPGVETLLPLMYSEGVASGRFGVSLLAKVLAERPARIFDLFPRKGQLAVGADADVVILDPQTSWILREEEMHSTAGWSPYNRKAMQGRVVQTLVRGKTVFKDGAVIGSPGSGRLVRPAA
ncbi:MAG: dihydroorotase [Chloroflexota bacterium]